MITSRTTEPEPVSSERLRQDQLAKPQALPSSTAGLAGLRTPSDAPLLAAPQDKPHSRSKQAAKRAWWPIALLVFVVGGLTVVAAGRGAERTERAPGEEAVPGEHGLEKLPERAPAAASDRTP